MFILFYRAPALGKTGSDPFSSHVEDIKDHFSATVLAFCLYVPPGVLENNNGIPLAVGALDRSSLLGGNGFSGPDDLGHHLRGWRDNSDVFVHAPALLNNGS